MPCALGIRFLLFDDDVTLLVDGFKCFDTREADSDEVTNTTAYDLEDAVQNYLRQNSPETLERLHFDCESSAFVVRSANSAALTAVAGAILEMARDPIKYRTHREAG